MALRDKKLATTVSATAEAPAPVADRVPTAQAPAQAAAAPAKDADEQWMEDNQDLVDIDDGVFDGVPELEGRVIDAAIDHTTATAAPPAVRQTTAVTNSGTGTAQQGGFLATQQELEQSGYVTDVAFGTFPQLVLNNLGLFECKDWSAQPLSTLTALHLVVVQVRRKWLYREMKPKGARIRYSYDDVPFPKNPNAADASGNPISAFTALIEGDGEQWESKLYYEALAVVVGGEGDGYQDHLEEMVLVSMSPTSKGKWSGYTIQTKFMKRLMPHQAITRVSRGPMMTAKDQNFYPLAFKCIGKADLSAFAAAEGVDVVGDVN